MRARVLQRGLSGTEGSCRDGSFCRAQGGLQAVGGGGGRAVERFGCALRARLAFRGLPLGLDGALPGVERVVQRLAVVALIHCRGRLVERGRRGGVFGGRVAFGAGGPRRGKRAARLIDLFLGWTGTACDDQQQKDDDRQATHDGKV